MAHGAEQCAPFTNTSVAAGVVSKRTSIAELPPMMRYPTVAAITNTAAPMAGINHFFGDGGSGRGTGSTGAARGAGGRFGCSKRRVGSSGSRIGARAGAAAAAEDGEVLIVAASASNSAGGGG